ncbi:carbohydrate binding family 9 domain-containing protein [Carboxylicivirga sp. A043]|uniref:carbohydrate binding family 9 domain-containing protein n=1 Tax=Carboxylicivirga litoralis TaxID=2816963 RepID=UPI0021CB3001|nr:carbohydrate binding family 9 domain-containing protein [Carboxylicivirga sp. A043]MCU4155062.1 carbohydrate binding family 9 domain-containing protein [Carboxylicivirga sp. A043]
MRFYIAITILFISTVPLFAQAPGLNRVTIDKTEHRFEIDGYLDEAGWANARLVDGFWQHWPNDTIPAEAKTEVRITYDDDYIYVGAVCYEENPSPVILSMRRDDEGNYWRSDAFCIAIDPNNNDKNGYFFGMNARGVQVDGTLAQRGANPYLDPFWDEFWEGEAQVTNDAYVYEMAIPFTSVKFNEDKNDWGINFIRNDMRRAAYDIWSCFPMAFSGLDFGYNGEVSFKDEVPDDKGGQFILIPSLSGGLDKNFEDDKGWEGTITGGLDAKWGIGSDLSLDLSVYPDFSTVYVDRQYIDFYRFEYYLPEMRSFFLENGDLFSSFGSYSDHTTVASDNRIKPLYTRRIGMYDWDYVPMIYGARFSGNVSDDVRIGLLNVSNEAYKDRTSQNYSAASFQWGVFKRSAIKGVFTNRQALYDDVKFDKDDYNRTAGLEFDYMNASGSWTGSIKYHYSFNPEKYSNAHFAGGELNYASSKLRVNNKLYQVGDNYIVDMGFVPRLYHKNDLNDTEFRQGFTEFTNFTTYLFYPESETFLYMTPGHRISLFANPDGEVSDYNGTLNLWGEFESRSAFNLFFNYEKATLLAPRDILHNDKPLDAGEYNFQSGGVHWSSDARKPLHVASTFEYGSFYNGTKTNAYLGMSYRLQTWGRLLLDYNYCRLDFPEPQGLENYHLVALTSEVALKKDLNWTTLVQFNTQKDNMNINSMVQWRFRPMSDFFIVVKDDFETGSFSNKRFQVNFKIRYWLSL